MSNDNQLKFTGNVAIPFTNNLKGGDVFIITDTHHTGKTEFLHKLHANISHNQQQSGVKDMILYVSLEQATINILRNFYMEAKIKPILDTLVVIATPSSPLSNINKELDRMKNNGDVVRCLFIDDVDQLSLDGEQGDDKTERMFKAVKDLAREYDIPVLTTTTTNSTNESPQLLTDRYKDMGVTCLDKDTTKLHTLKEMMR